MIEDFSKKVKEEKKVSKEAKISVTIFLIAMVGIVLLGAVSGLVPTLADGSKLPLTTVIEIFMLEAAAAMILLTKLDRYVCGCSGVWSVLACKYIYRRSVVIYYRQYVGADK